MGAWNLRSIYICVLLFQQHTPQGIVEFIKVTGVVKIKLFFMA